MRLAKALPIVRDYVLMTTGALCIAVSINLFLAPNNVIAGGVTGVAIILNSLVGSPIGLMILLLNIPLFIVGWRALGGLVFGVRTVFAVVVLSFAIDALAPLLTPVTTQPLLFILYGGLLDGLGTGLIFRGLGTSGGIDIVARLLERWRGVAPGRSLLAMNALTYAGAFFIYGAEPVLFALLASFISSRAVNVVLEGSMSARQALIVTARPAEITAAVLHDLARGVTVLEGRGGYTRQERAILLCVVLRSELSFLKQIIATADPDAFVIVGEVAEVLGEGFGAGTVRRAKNEEELRIEN
ncbi:MAG: YitT family protein [Chloroflexales bacterium]|nr:YitT family protein [Chloroflexales bacterium]